MNLLPKLAAEKRRRRNALVGLLALVAAGIALVLVGERCGAAEAAPVTDLAELGLRQSIRPLLPKPGEVQLAPLLSLPVGPPAPEPSPHEVRVATAALIVRTLYNHPGRANFLPYVGHLVAQHEWYEQEGHRKGYPYAEGFAEAYWYSLVYGGANFSLRCYAVAPGNCAGPMDVKHAPLILDPKRNVEWHVAEFWTGQRKGYRGLGLCRYTMYPARPFDWGGGRFRKTDARHQTVIRRAYREGRLTP